MPVEARPEHLACMIVNQWVPAAHRGDAIGDSARLVRDLLRGMGHASDIFALTIDDDLRGDVRPFDDPEARRGDVTIFHFALPSPMTEAFAALAGGRSCSITTSRPRRSSRRTTPALFRLAALGREELAPLAGRVDLALGDSEFNRAELEALGFAPTGVMPIAVNTARITHRPRRPALERILNDGLINILFVGRIVPNKKIEDHIRLAELYKRYVDSLLPVHLRRPLRRGAALLRAVRALIAEYRMLPDRFWFTGPVPDEDLAAFYRWADAYVSLSEHEGFCVPLVEAMAADVPIAGLCGRRRARDARRRGRAVRAEGSRTRRGAARRARIRRELRARVLDGQRRRLQDFGAARIERNSETLSAGCICASPQAWKHVPFIVQRYGTEILGGSEYHCRLIAERLAPQPPGRGPDDLRAGLHHVEERVSRRHRPHPRRDGAPLRQRAARATSTPSTATRSGSSTTRTRRDDEMEWLKQQGPWCPALLEYLERQPPAVRRSDLLHLSLRADRAGLRVAPHKSILVPTAHDEPAIRLGIYKDVFSRAGGASPTTTDVERRFLTTQFLDRALDEEAVGCGVDLPQAQVSAPNDVAERREPPMRRCRRRPMPDEETPPREFPAAPGRRAASLFRRRHRLHGPIALYGGRIDPGKGCEELIEYFSSYVQEGGDASLVLMGVEADAAARGAVHPVRRAPLGPGAAAGARGGDRGGRAVAVREPVAARARSVRGRDADSGQRAERGPGRPLPCKSNAGLYYADRDEFVES